MEITRAFSYDKKKTVFTCGFFPKPKMTARVSARKSRRIHMSWKTCNGMKTYFDLGTPVSFEEYEWAYSRMMQITGPAGENEFFLFVHSLNLSNPHNMV